MTRICAVLKADDKDVYLIGYGSYVGDEIPDNNTVGPMAEILKQAKIKNPKLVMDDGSIVWGCECWWGDVDVANEFMGKRNIVHVDMQKERQANV